MHCVYQYSPLLSEKDALVDEVLGRARDSGPFEFLTSRTGLHLHFALAETSFVTADREINAQHRVVVTQLVITNHQKFLVAQLG